MRRDHHRLFTCVAHLFCVRGALRMQYCLQCAHFVSLTHLRNTRCILVQWTLIAVPCLPLSRLRYIIDSAQTRIVSSFSHMRIFLAVSFCCQLLIAALLGNISAFYLNINRYFVLWPMQNSNPNNHLSDNFSNWILLFTLQALRPYAFGGWAVVISWHRAHSVRVFLWCAVDKLTQISHSAADGHEDGPATADCMRLCPFWSDDRYYIFIIKWHNYFCCCNRCCCGCR